MKHRLEEMTFLWFAVSLSLLALGQLVPERTCKMMRRKIFAACCFRCRVVESLELYNFETYAKREDALELHGRVDVSLLDDGDEFLSR